MARAICILGMHRSGTSLVARVLDGLGVHLGLPRDHLAPNFANPGGYWELTPVVRLHDALLQRLGRTWDTAFPLPDGWVDDPRIQVYGARLKRVLETRLEGHGVFGWKDPRTCLTLPLWRRILRERRIAVDYLLVYRNPLDVAHSLARRNGFRTQAALGLWFHYNLEMVRESRGESRMLLRYEDLLSAPEREIQRIAAAFDLGEPEDLAMRIVDPGLRHHSSTTEDLAESAPRMVRRLHDLLCRTTRNEMTWDALDAEVDELHGDWCRYAEVLGHDGGKRAQVTRGGLLAWMAEPRIHALSEFTEVLETTLDPRRGGPTPELPGTPTEASPARRPRRLRRMLHATLGLILVRRPLPFFAVPGGVVLAIGIALAVRARLGGDGGAAVAGGLLSFGGFILVLMGLLADHLYVHRRLLEALERRLGEIRDTLDSRPGPR